MARKVKPWLLEGVWVYVINMSCIQKNANHSITACLGGKYNQGKGSIEGEHLKLVGMGGVLDSPFEYHLVFSK